MAVCSSIFCDQNTNTSLFKFEHRLNISTVQFVIKELRMNDFSSDVRDSW